jgi:hypothetical protein
MAAASEDPAILDPGLPEHDRSAAEVMPSSSVWHGRGVMRFSVSSWCTGPAEVRDTIRGAQVPTQQPAAVGE